MDSQESRQSYDLAVGLSIRAYQHKTARRQNLPAHHIYFPAQGIPGGEPPQLLDLMARLVALCACRYPVFIL